MPITPIPTVWRSDQYEQAKANDNRGYKTGDYSAV